jgi:predicted Fe-Mo cluster-binding NifX family protein
MKIAVPSMGKTLESFVSNNFGRSPFVIIYNDENKKYNYFENIGFKIQDGSGLKAAEILIRNNADVLLTREIGRKAYSVLMKEHININLLNLSGTVKSTLKKFLKKEYNIVRTFKNIFYKRSR